VLLGAAERLAHGEVRPPVADVRDRLDERALEPEEADDPHERAQDRAEPPEREREHERHEAEEQVDDEGERHQVLPVGLVVAPRFPDDLACPHARREPTTPRFA
jgi:hypothetical protein